MSSIIIQDEISRRVREIEREIIFLRRYFHKNPELSRQEVKTSNFIYQKLIEYGVHNVLRYSNNGISCTIGGSSSQNVVGIRAEMDALPIAEKNQVDYSSANEGVMHACGHDAHMAIVLSVAKILMQMKTKLPGAVKLIFQPSEEVAPGGAVTMISEGVLNNPSVNLMLGLHVLPELQTGKIGIKANEYLASSDELFIKIYGRGGHAALPEETDDMIFVASQLIFYLQQKTSYKKNILLRFGKIIADGKTNVIPDTLIIEGTLRTFNENLRKEIQKAIIDTSHEIATAYNVKIETNIIEGYPVLVNEEILTNKIKQILTTFWGEENIIEVNKRMTSDDFSYYSQLIPSCFLRLGTAFENTLHRRLHTSTFDINEESLKIGTITLLICVFELLDWLKASR